MSSFIKAPGEFFTTDAYAPYITIVGLSSDTKPTASQYTNYRFLETDTGHVFQSYNAIWNQVAQALAQNYGLSTQNGGGTTFTIAHGLYTTPNTTNVTAKSSDALGPFKVTVDINNITVTYGISTSSGTNNISLWWEAKV